MADLSARVHSGVGPTGTREGGGLQPQHPTQRQLELTLHGAVTRLRSPPGKAAAVIGDVEPQAHRGVER